MDKKNVKKSSEKESNTMTKYFNQIKTMYTKPNSFFKKVENQDFLGTLRFCAIFYVIFFVLSIIIKIILILAIDRTALANLGFFNSILSIIKITILNFVGFFLILALILILILIFSWINKSFLRLTKVKANYLDSFKPIIYSIVLISCYIFLTSYILTPIFQLTIPADYTYLDQMQSIESMDAYWQLVKSFFIQPSILIIGLITLAGFIHGLFFVVKGISKLNKISKLKSFLGIISSTVIGLIIIYLLLLILSSGVSPA